jgi:hypothetical protein
MQIERIACNPSTSSLGPFGNNSAWIYSRSSPGLPTSGAADVAPVLPVRFLVFFTAFTEVSCAAAFWALTASHPLFVA